MANLKSLAKDTAIYGLSSIIGRFLNYLLVPLYTAKISAASGGYGVITNMYAYTALLLVIEQYAGEYTLNGTGDYEGWLILRRSFTLEHRNNPYWKCIELKDVPILNSEYVNVE